MIDTGSTRSFIHPKIAHEFFWSFIKYEPFQVISTHASSIHNEVIEIPLPPTFKCPYMHKFYLYNVDSQYEGLIGNDLLKQLEAVIDLGKCELKTAFTNLPIVYNQLQYELKLKPRSEQRVLLPTNVHSGVGILNYTEFVQGVRMPSALVTCEKGYAMSVIQNTLDDEMILTINKPFEVIPYTKTECVVNSMQDEVEVDKLLEENLTKLHAIETENDSVVVNVDSDTSTLTADELPLSDNSSTLTAASISPTEQQTLLRSSSSTETAHSCADLESFGIPILQEAIDTKPNQILVFIWNKNELQVKDISRDRQKILEVFLPTGNYELIKRFLKEHIKPKLKYFIFFESVAHRKEFSNIIIGLFKRDTVKFYECTERVMYVEDENEQKEIVLKHHEGKTCHRGIRETMVRIRRHYFWINMQETISAIINACDACNKMKYDRRPIKPILQLTETQHAPFQEIFIDLFSIEGQYYLTCVDAFSKLGQAINIRNRSTPEVVRALIKYFSYYGTPKKITCDPGKEFNNDLLRELLDLYKIQLHISTPNNPNSTGIVERFHSTLIEIYRLAKYEKKCTDAASVMSYSIMAYNHTIHSTTDLTPFELVFGHADSSNPIVTDFDKIYKQQLVKDHQKRTKYLYNYIYNKMHDKKQLVKNKKGGETITKLDSGDIIYTKDINTRKSKDKPRYHKAKVLAKVKRNIVPVEIRERETRVPIKNIKRHSQVLLSGPDCIGDKPCSSTAVT